MFEKQECVKTVIFIISLFQWSDAAWVRHQVGPEKVSALRQV